MKKRVFLCFLASVLFCLGAAASAAAHPFANRVVTVWPEGWKFHYQDGHTSDGEYPTIEETGEPLFCLQPHVNATTGPREQWTDLAQYFDNDTAFAQKLSLTAYYSLHSGWGNRRDRRRPVPDLEIYHGAGRRAGGAVAFDSRDPGPGSSPDLLR